jgi:hypothetical protein
MVREIAQHEQERRTHREEDEKANEFSGDVAVQ